MAGYVGKGNWNEWETARALSKWLTDGQDKTQLIRSVMSGGHQKLRDAAEFQVGDLAPNGEKGREFRKIFGVECKNYSKDPEWWHAFTSKNWIVEKWWNKIMDECRPHDLVPLLIMKRNRCPEVVMMPSWLPASIIEPDMTLPLLQVSVVRFDRFRRFPPDAWYEAVRSHKQVTHT